jgi:hypothetical protein
MTTVCPKCQKDDRIARLPAIIQAGRASGSYAGPSGGVTHSDGKFGGVGGWTTLQGSITTDLARVLAPPVEPRQRGGLGAWWILIFLCSMWVCAAPANLISRCASSGCDHHSRVGSRRSFLYLSVFHRRRSPKKGVCQRDLLGCQVPLGFCDRKMEPLLLL